MELPIDSEIACFGIAMSEAIEELVNEHDLGLDKRAAMQTLSSPALRREDSSLEFVFSARTDKSLVASPSISVMPEMSSGTGRRRASRDLSLVAMPRCDCDLFAANGQCPHTLAAAWWLQQQLSRRDNEALPAFLGELQVDAVALGRGLVDELLRLAVPPAAKKADVGMVRVQWRLHLSSTSHATALTISPFEQRARKMGGAWSKGRALRALELETREELNLDAVDSRVASLVNRASSSHGAQGYSLYEAVLGLAGRDNVAWNDPQGTPLSVLRGEMTLALQRDALPAEQESAQWDGSAGEEVATDSDELIASRYRIRLGISGVDLEISAKSCEIVSGKVGPGRPLLLVIPKDRRRLLACELKSNRAARLVDHLLDQELEEVRLDGPSASRLALAVGRIDPLIRIDLPPELSGPIQPAQWQLVVELRPRNPAGLQLTLRIRDPRFGETYAPGGGPELVRCASDEGPVRVQRDLQAEIQRARQLVNRFDIDSLPSDGSWRWTAASDEAALDLLASLYAAGDEAPPILWPEGQTVSVRGELTPQSLRLRIDDGQDWFGVSGEIDIEGLQVPLAELLEAVRENRSLVRVGDRQFARISDAFRRRLRQLGDSIQPDRGNLRVADAAVPVVQELLGDDLAVELASRWESMLRRLNEIRDWVPQLPEGLQGELRPYQVDGYRWLARLARWGVGGVLADDMGLGKTVQALAVLLDRAADGPALVVSPTSVGENWLRETGQFAPSLTGHIYRDHDRQRLIESVGPGDLVIVSYQLLQRDVARFASRPWQTLVLDEAQFIKNAATKTSRAIRSLQADWRIALSGTPLENHLGELWSLFRTLSPGLLGSWERFRVWFAEPIQRRGDQERKESLARLVRPFILRRTKRAVLQELPERTEVTLSAELSDAERKRYEEARLAAVAELAGERQGDGEGGDRRMRTLAWLTKLRQLACHPRLVDSSWRQGSAKLSLLLETIEELREEGNRALVFSQFVRHLELVRAVLDDRGISYQYLDGSTPAAERQRRVDAFQDGQGELFLISLKAGGTGLNLTAANYVLHLDPWWNPAVEDQATDRAHRIGQHRAVTVYRLVSSGTIEEQIISLHASKRELVAGVLDGTDQAARLNTEELIELIRAGH